jgi:dTDP-glucose 4,6-dehydratase
MKKDIILILGSNSFSGACLIENILNKKKYNVISVFNKNKNFFFIPFNKKQLLFEIKINLLHDVNKLIKVIHEEKPSVIVDFASNCNVSQSWIDTEEIIKINFLNKVKLIKEISNLRFLKKYIYISTPEIFGSNNYSIKENSKNYNPSSPYATSKLAFELFLNNYNKTFNFPSIISRFANFYGPSQSFNRLIPRVILSIIKKEKLILEGKGNYLRSYIYKDDFCDGISRIIEIGSVGDTYHFSGNNFFSTKKIIEIACDLFNYDYNELVIKGKERVSQDYSYKLNDEFTKKKLKWKSKIEIENGMKNIYNHYIKNFNFLNKLL